MMDVENVVDEQQEDIQDDQQQNPEEVGGETPADSQSADGDQTVADDPEGMIVTIGDEKSEDDQDPKDAPKWVKEVRRQNRELVREIRELKAKQPQSEPSKLPEIGPRPRLSDPNIDYDEEKFDAAMDVWQQKKTAVEAELQSEQQKVKQQQQEWNDRLSAHDKAKAALKVSDLDEVEDVLQATFSQVQRAILITGAENSALLEYAIGKNPAKAKALAAINDPVKFAFALAKLETQVKTQPRKPPAPESKVRGNAAPSGAIDNQLERLRAEAEKTGDMSKVIAYKRSRQK